jgi:hypothetical protein
VQKTKLVTEAVKLLFGCYYGVVSSKHQSLGVETANFSSCIKRKIVPVAQNMKLKVDTNWAAKLDS